MNYENKEYILQFFEGVHEEENRAELIEVYRKAKAFDQTKETLKEDVEKLEKLEKDFPLSCQDELEKLNNILVLMTRYESGESDA